MSCVLTLAYLSARDTYRVEREALAHLENPGDELSEQAPTTNVVGSLKNKGYADFTFHPRRKNDTPFIVELKKDTSPEVAINQILQKEYVSKFKKEYSHKKILAVAICYNTKTKEHDCIIQEV